MKHANNSVINTLQNQGYRITTQRKEIIKILEKSASPQTIKELVAKASSDEASVYRTIRVLQKEALLEEIRPDGQPAQYSLCNHHHDHAICRECGVVKHIPCSFVKNPALTAEGFSDISSHELILYGLCVRCA